MTEKEFAYFSQRQRAKLTAIANKLVSGADRAEEAEDIVQETLLTLWNLLQGGYPAKDPEALVVTIAKNISVAHYRKTHIKVCNIESFDCPEGTNASQKVEETDQLLIKNNLYSHLSATQRKYMELRENEGLSLDEMATVTGKPKTSIKTTLSAARKQLMEELKKTL